MYTAQKENNNYAIYKDRVRIATASAAGLVQYGLSEQKLSSDPRSLSFSNDSSGNSTGTISPSSAVTTSAGETYSLIPPGYSIPHGTIVSVGGRGYRAENGMLIPAPSFDGNSAAQDIEKFASSGSSGSADTYGTPAPAKIEPSTVLIESLPAYIQKMIEMVIASKKVVNPGLTAEDLAAVDPKNFLAQAEASISPYYKSKFQVIKDDLSKTFSNLGYDLGVKKEEINRQTEQNRLSGEEELSGRGLTFSSTKDTFLSDTEAARQRSLTAADVAAQRAGDVAGSSAQAQLGTAETPSLSFGGYNYNPNTRYNTPIIGSLPQERQFDIETRSKLFASDEARKRAYAVGALSFG